MAVLAGGRGARLGGAKAIAGLGGAPLLSYALHAARDAGLDAIVLAKPDTQLPRLREQVILEPASPRHPLCGFVRALEHAASVPGSPAVVLLACDMPFVSGALLRHMAELHAGAATVMVDGQMQPMLCRCEPHHLPALRAALESSRPLREAIASLSPILLDEPALSRFGNPRRLCFNVNSPQDLALAQAWISDRARPGEPRPRAAARGPAASARRSSS